jgi:hypothetical protein
MAFCTVNGSPMLEGTINLPRIGVWTADVELPAPESLPTGGAMITLGTQTFVGTFARTGFDGRGRMRARIVGGAAGLGGTLAPKSYLGVPLRIPLQDVLTDAGERLSSAADQDTLGFQVPAWSRMQAIAGISLAAIAAVTGASWRMLSDGSVWVGAETWPKSAMQAAATSFEPEAKRRTVASLAPIVLPGQVFDGEHVAFVQHLIDARTLRTVLHLE